MAVLRRVCIIQTRLRNTLWRHFVTLRNIVRALGVGKELFLSEISVLSENQIGCSVVVYK